jgi:signal transduction histidine kinase
LIKGISLSAIDSNDLKFQGLFTRESIEAQQQRLSSISRFPFMKFEAQLEAAFEQFRYQRLIRRIPVIGITGLVLFSAFSILDFFSLPEAVYQISIALRLLLICPLIILIMYMAAKPVDSFLFTRVYLSVYLVAGCAIILIIYTADIHKHYLPYDGILLHLVFGYFLMGLPYTLATYGSLVISAIYIIMSSYISLPFEQLASNSMFIISLNFIGAIGSFMQERARRFLFLNEKLIELSKAKDKKEIASKTRLVAVTSHDLKQPLHAMNLLIETLNDQLPEGKHKEIVSSLDTSVKQLSQLLSTLLDISKLNAGIVEPTLSHINLSEKINNFCQALSLRALEANIRLSCEGAESVYIHVDPILFDRIIRNVMENIFVHADASEVSFSWVRERNIVRLEVTDNGKGIAEQDLQKIFEEFQQSGDSSRTGMGLGLSIVKQLAELQKIEYGLSSMIDKGSSFWFKLPIGEDQELSAGQKQQEMPFAQVSIIKKSTSYYAETWFKQFTVWGYNTVILPMGSNMSSEHIVRALRSQSQILVWDAQDAPNLDEVVALMDEVQSRSHFSLPILVVTELTGTDIKNTKSRIPDNVTIEMVSPAARPAKLRLILEHLANII